MLRQHSLLMMILITLTLTLQTSPSQAAKKGGRNSKANKSQSVPHPNLASDVMKKRKAYDEATSAYSLAKSKLAASRAELHRAIKMKSGIEAAKSALEQALDANNKAYQKHKMTKDTLKRALTTATHSYNTHRADVARKAREERNRQLSKGGFKIRRSGHGSVSRGHGSSRSGGSSYRSRGGSYGGGHGHR